jgi:hypothetical protein
MRCKLVLRYSTGGEDDLAASTIDAVYQKNKLCMQFRIISILPAACMLHVGADV